MSKKINKILNLMTIVLVFIQSIFVNTIVMAKDTESIQETLPQDMDPNSEEYRKWKEDYTSNSVYGSVYNKSNSITVNSLMRTAMTATNVLGNKLSNEYIEFAVNNNGRFTIGTTGGNPDNKSDDNKKMLYGHPDPRTSYTTIKVDDVDNIYQAHSAVKFDSDNDCNTSECNIGKVSVKQVLSIIENTSTKRKDVVEIKYIVQNNDTVEHTVGVRIMLDTMLGNNDEAPFRIPSMGAVTTETEFTGDNIPDYWQAFDNIISPTVISQGSLLQDMENKIDKIQFCSWRKIWDITWNYSINAGEENGDSAVAMYWNPKKLLPGEIREYVTYYGLSQLTQDLKPPIALSLAAPKELKYSNNGYAPNPFTITAYMNNNGNDTAKNTKIKIVLQEGLKLKGGEIEKTIGDLKVNEFKQVSWKVEVPTVNLIENKYEYSVTVWADNAEAKTIKMPLIVPAIEIYRMEIGPDDLTKNIDTNNPFKIRYFINNDVEVK